MNIIILGVRIIEDSDNRGSDNRGCTVSPLIALMNDQVDSINAMGISAIKIGSSNTIELKDHISSMETFKLFLFHLKI